MTRNGRENTRREGTSYTPRTLQSISESLLDRMALELVDFICQESILIRWVPYLEARKGLLVLDAELDKQREKLFHTRLQRAEEI